MIRLLVCFNLIDSCSRLGVMFSFVCILGVSCECVVVVGWVMMDFVLFRLFEIRKIFI